MPAESITRARRLIQHFVDKEMGEDDVAAVASASGQLGFLQQLTGNRDVLRTAVSRLKPWPQSGGDGQLPIMSEYTARAIDVDNDRDVFETYVQAQNFVAQRSAERRFKRDTPLRFMTYIYNAQGAPPALEARIQVLRAGSPVLTYDKLKVDPGADFTRGIAYGAEIPLDALAPGRYVLQLTVTNRGAQADASGRTLFTVE